MADERLAASSTTTTGGGNGFLYFAIGALIVAVGVLGWMFYDGGWRQERTDSAVERTLDKVGDAAKDVGNAARTIPTPAPAPAPSQPAPSPAPTPANPG